MIFSKSCEYALRSTLYICNNSVNESRINVNDIAENIESPVSYTAKILQQLVRNKIISSTKGPHGGFYIDNNLAPITILQVVEAIEGPTYFDRCIVGLKECSSVNPCPLHPHFAEHRNSIKELFKNKTIMDLITFQNGSINLK